MQGLPARYLRMRQVVSPVLLPLASLLLALLLYIVILFLPSSVLFRQVAIAARYSFLKTAVILFTGCYAAFCIRGQFGSIASLMVVVGVFGLDLLGLWSSGESTSTVISGLLPWSDAAQYYQDALRVLAGGGVQAFTSWRPLFAGLLSGLLAITGMNLQVSLAVLGGLVAVACFLLARETQRQFGPLSAAFVVLILFFYYRQRISGMALSEQLGLSLGMLGFALLLRGAGSLKWRLVLFGVFLEALALNTRPGPFFVLPGLMLWAGWLFRKKKAFSWPTFLGSGIASAAAFGVNSLVRNLLSTESSLPFANFAYALYGLATGGRRYSSALLDHPELSQLSGNEHFLSVYSLAIQEILRNPFGLLTGMLKNWSLFVSFNWYSVYGYMISETEWITLITRVVLYALCLVGIVRCIRMWPDPKHQLLLFSGVGLVLSVPFVPPSDAYGVRLYAASMPIAALLPALGLSFLRQPLAKYFPWETKVLPLKNEYSAAFAALLAAAVVITPLLTKTISQKAVLPAGNCPEGREAVYLQMAPGSAVNVLPEATFFLDRLPDFHAGRFTRQIHGLPAGEQMDTFEQLEAPFTLFETVDLITLRSVWLLVVPGQSSTARAEKKVFCGRWIHEPGTLNIGLFEARGRENAN